ncbi:MAG: Asp-tRNA(Asn)/Glu-tRNA(Gln) amidotransferase subunit GatB [Patescibacteria group bacterium]|nr:Asp-tRNA(Asn)/Glu-tRNA(Gln) amidotransferase subunit GatB [Patescibacteria group bacterium]
MKHDVIIGLEIHAELKTKSKMFCGCDNDAQGKEPNTVVCPVCLAHPGTLPVPNKQAIEWTILVGLALNCKINQLSKFDRKNYFYPDLPKGYQISQYDLPIAYDGFLEIDGKPILITRIHLEEDTGKLIHPAGKKHTLVDYNRAGTPLIELVTEPIIRDAATAKKFAQEYQKILRFLDISHADMEKGEMRCEANISVQEQGKWQYLNGQIKPLGNYKLNPKVELKNINSFRYMEKAVEYEIKRQIKALADGAKLVQETRGWNNEKGITTSLRIKETSADYRYFPEPDIPPLRIDQTWIKKIKARLPELPAQKIKRFKEEYFFSDYESEILAGDKALAKYTEEVITELRAWIETSGDTWERQKHKLAKATANWLINELFKHLKTNSQTISQVKITPENFAEFISLIYQDKINSSAAQTILAKMYERGGDPTQIMDELGLKQLDDKEALEKVIAEVIFKNQKQAQEYKNGKTAVLQFFIGQVMADTKGKANPKLVAEILKSVLAK